MCVFDDDDDDGTTSSSMDANQITGCRFSGLLFAKRENILDSQFFLMEPYTHTHTDTYNISYYSFSFSLSHTHTPFDFYFYYYLMKSIEHAMDFFFIRLTV